MNKQEIIERLETVKRLRFYEEMADFMNWTLYHQYTKEIRDLEKQLEALN